MEEALAVIKALRLEIVELKDLNRMVKYFFIALISFSILI
jgi:hypothetical protein